MTTQEQVWEGLRGRVCVKCVDGDGRGQCRIARGTACTIKEHFDKVLVAVNSVFSPSIEPYEEQLRRSVCSTCSHQDSAGVCSLRDAVECALDRYFPLIVEVIEDTQLRTQSGVR